EKFPVKGATGSGIGGEQGLQQGGAGAGQAEDKQRFVDFLLRYAGKALSVRDDFQAIAEVKSLAGFDMGIQRGIDACLAGNGIKEDFEGDAEFIAVPVVKACGLLGLIDDAGGAQLKGHGGLAIYCGLSVMSAEDRLVPARNTVYIVVGNCPE